jgi:4-amino-4-deoxy-L-arabinose transferase-like glycosyltransferase
MLAEVGLLGLVALTSLARRRTRTTKHSVPAGRRSRLLLLLALLFLVTLTAAGAAFLSTLRQHPHGEWDAWMNWDLRARMIFRGGEEWRTAFSGAIPWSHPDYPVLVPSLVTRSWIYAGMETLLGPWLVAATFTFGAVALVVAGLAALRSWSQGLLAGLVLLSTPFFIMHGTSLYADVPLGFFFLATFVCLALDGRYGGATNRFAMLAGLAAGIGMWTKNEGLLFAVAGAGAILFARESGGWAASRRRLLAFGAGLLPLLLLVVSFKIAFAPPNDLLSTLSVERTLSRLSSPDRYYIVLRAYASHIASFGHNGFGSVMWVLAAYLLGLGANRGELSRPWVRAGMAALGLVLAGHFMVFVSMADELPRLLKSSLDRLLLQLLPSALFLFFMVARTPEEARAARPLLRFRAERIVGSRIPS